VRLTDAGRTQQHHHLGIGDEPPGRDLADLLFVERGLGGEVEAVEIADKWEARQPDAHLDPPLILTADLALAEQRERLSNGQLTPGCLVDQAVELITDRRQLEPVEHRD
jgi:hypothetical protein